MKVNLGCGNVRKAGYVGVDIFPGPEVDIVADGRFMPFFKSDSVEVVYASHVAEHVVDLHPLMKEIHRILKPGGRLVALVPYGLRSLYDPNHYHAFNETTFRFFTRNNGSGHEANRSLQRFPLFDEESTRLDSLTQFLRFIPKLQFAIESRPKIAWLVARAQSTALFRVLPKGRWPQLVVILRKPEANT